MDFALTEHQERWLDELRAFLREHFTPAVQEELWDLGHRERGPNIQAFLRKVASMGWCGLALPAQFGGMGKSTVEQFLFADEFDYWGAPTPDLMTIASIAPTIMRFGTDEQRHQWLPRIVSGEIEMALGYSEPEAGSDIANIATTAELDGDEWVINGQKIWNSGAHRSTHEWLACRTDPHAPKHRGISMLVVPIDLPGITVRPLWGWGDVRTNEIWFENVRVPKANLIGEVNRGWYYMATALDFERVAIGVTGGLRRLLEDLVQFCKELVIDGEALARKPHVRQRLAELAVELEVARMLSWHTAWIIDAGQTISAEASMTKIYTTELRARLSDVGMQLLDMYGQLGKRDRWAPLHGRVEEMYRRAPYLRFGGGTNELQRNIIAQRGLGLPR